MSTFLVFSMTRCNEVTDVWFLFVFNIKKIK